MKKLAPLFVLMASVLWGSMGIVTRYVADIGFTTRQTAAVRICSAAAVLILFLLITDHRKLKIEKQDLKWFLGTGDVYKRQDLDAIMREQKIPLFALESQDPIKDFDFLGITIQYEMCYTNILQILDLSQIPWRASARDESDPIVIGGGPCTYNPEPLLSLIHI